MYVVVFFTCCCEIWSFVLKGPVDGLWSPHSDALMLQNIAHFFNLSNSFFQVVHRKRLATMLLVEGPVLLICVSLLRDLQYDNMQISLKFLCFLLAGTFFYNGIHMEMCCSGKSLVLCNLHISVYNIIFLCDSLLSLPQ